MASFFLVRNPMLHGLDHQMKRGFQGIGNSPKPNRSGVQNSALQTADIGAVKAAIRCELLLGDTGAMTGFAHDDAYRPALEVCGTNLTCAPERGHTQ